MAKIYVRFVIFCNICQKKETICGIFITVKRRRYPETPPATPNQRRTINMYTVFQAVHKDSIVHNFASTKQ